MSKKKHPSCPGYLSPIGKAKWKQVINDLDNLGLLHGSDTHLIESLCEHYSEYREALEVMQQPDEGRVKELPNNYAQVNCWQKIKLAAAKEYRLLLKELGLTPSQRKRLDASEDFIDPKWGEFED